MSISIKKNESPNLPQCKMLCDNGLHDKLNAYELTKMMNEHSTNVFIGRPKSGKSSLLYSFFKSPKLFRKVFSNVFIFRPTTSSATVDDDIFGTLPKDQQYSELTIENLAEVESKIMSADSKEHNCIIFDDMTAYLKNSDTLKMLKSILMNRRHLHVSIFFLVQTWFSVPKEFRRLFSNLFVFKVSKNELTNIFDECIEYSKDYVLPISNLVYDVPYNFLFINFDSKRVFKNWDELILKDE